MGAYINPPDMTKEDWLDKNAERLDGHPGEFDSVPGFLPVCLVDNGLFTAAAIAYSQGELEVFLSDRSGRPKQWYLAKIDDLKKVSNISDYSLT